MPDLWMPGAERLDIGDHAPTDGGPAKAIAHITWDKNATAASPVKLVPYENLRSYFSGGGASVAPHILWDPWTGRISQFVPANSRSKSVVDLQGGTRTNRAGSVVIQVEALFFPYCKTTDGKVWAKLSDTPCKGWAELHAWIKSWGVPDTWPMGRPTDFTSHRSESVWETKAGWYAHAHVPENDHTDPGSWPAFPTSTPVIEEDPMAGITKQDVTDAVWKAAVAAPDTAPDKKTNPTWWAASYLRAIYGSITTLRDDVAKLRAEVADIKKGA
ncbi:hypothetical protein [Streptomyces sp. SID8499]|uniref:hypothetical protein n=1 Tax=Streptomyces sp. SID8499 TaxID=2706106 RepID=UPI00194371DF|nr:hypothetical protein [Streptomyces sp. SID8499]